METDPKRAEPPPQPAGTTSFDADSGESEEVHAPSPEVSRANANGPEPVKHRRDFLRILGTMTFLTAGLEKLGSTGHAAQGTPCGIQPVEGGPAAKDHNCGTYTASGELNPDNDCGKPSSATEYHQDNDCGKETGLGFASDDSDCTKPGHTDQDCGKTFDEGNTVGYEDNDCSQVSQDSDCGIVSPGGKAHTDSDCHAGYASDSDCGKAATGGGTNYDSDCGPAPPVYNGDSDCARAQQTGGNGLSGDQDCVGTGFDSTCSANDQLLRPADPDPPLPPDPPPP